jgi:phage gpG-like protein
MNNDEEASKAIKMDITGLKKLQKALKTIPKMRVGIFKNSRTDGGNNASIGAEHEFGSARVPQRSWLRVPLQDFMPSKLDQFQEFKDEDLKQVIKTGSFQIMMKLLGELAVKIIKEGFETGGFGKWKRWKDPHYKNRTGKILLDTKQLKESVSFEVK